MKLTPQETPFPTFEAWMAEAAEKEINDPSAVALATVDSGGRPSVRMVLLRGWGPDGFVFYTNLESRKGMELKSNSYAALCLYWKSIRRQIRIEGTVVPVTEAEADAYFASRPRGSRIGAWASKQSRPLESPRALEKAVAQYTAKFGLGGVPRPEYWSGFRLKPDAVEFWASGEFRLHRRLLYRREGETWSTTALYP